MDYIVALSHVYFMHSHHIYSPWLLFLPPILTDSPSSSPSFSCSCVLVQWVSLNGTWLSDCIQEHRPHKLISDCTTKGPAVPSLKTINYLWVLREEGGLLSSASSMRGCWFAEREFKICRSWVDNPSGCGFRSTAACHTWKTSSWPCTILGLFHSFLSFVILSEPWKGLYRFLLWVSTR